MIRSAVTTPSILGECPLWSAAENVLYWLDIDGRLVHRLDPESGIDETRSLSTRPGSIALTTSPGILLLASEQQLHWFTWETGELRLFHSFGNESPDRLNDGRTDPAGRFVVGTLQADASEPPTQQVQQVDGSRDSSVLFGDFMVSNGIAFDPNRNRMYFADTPTETVMVYDYEAESGTCENGRLFIDYSTIPGKPDGACVDSEGCYWSASVYGWAVTRFTPDGDVERRIELPLEKPSMPAFGGPNLTTLYVTTIGSGGAVPSAPGKDGFVPGSVLAIELDDCSGVLDPVFAGSPTIAN